MYNVKLYNYVPEPQPAKSDRVVAAHYYAVWKKGAAEIHDAFNMLHDYPERTPLMGYYDESNPEVCDWEIKWATEHGVNCFIHCWYRRLENMGKPVTVDMLRCGHGLHEALFNAKYQKYMNFAIMFENCPRWGTVTGKEDLLENVLPFWMENYFKRDNYLKIDNKPVVFVFAHQRFDEALGTPEEQKAALDACREYCKSHGFDGMIFAPCNTSTDPEVHAACLARGYDFRFGYGSGYGAPYDFPENKDAMDGQVNLLTKRLSQDPMHFIPTASCFLDTTPRANKHWRITLGYDFETYNVWYITPNEYREVLQRMKDVCDSLPEGAWAKKIIMLDNWNEWDEGHFISPSHQFGFGYLQALREVFTERNNLPDYRTPQDLGFTGYDDVWEKPDMTKVCQEILDSGLSFKELVLKRKRENMAEE